jgi:hypothetical protein
MTKFSLLLFLLAFLAGCSKPAPTALQDAIDGKWRIISRARTSAAGQHNSLGIRPVEYDEIMQLELLGPGKGILHENILVPALGENRTSKVDTPVNVNGDEIEWNYIPAPPAEDVKSGYMVVSHNRATLAMATRKGREVTHFQAVATKL